MKSPANLEDLRKLLLDHKKSSRGGTENRILARLFDNLVLSMGTKSGITDAVLGAFSEISAQGLYTDPNLVADTIVAVDMAYPFSGSSLICALEGFTSAYISRAGEGIAIGLLEISGGEDISFQTAMIKSFQSGSIVTSMLSSSATPSGSGRLANAIQSFVSGTWVKQGPISEIRRIQITGLLKRWSEILRSQLPSSKDPSNPVDGFWNFSNYREKTFLETFADELSKRFFINSPLGLRFYLSQFLKDNVPAQLIQVSAG